MKKIAIIICSIFAVLQVQAQFSASYSFGYGSYKMKDLERFLEITKEKIMEQYPGMDPHIVDKFPGYITHNLDLSYQLKNHEFGIKSTYLTTGGKLSQTDYSGEYEDKITLTAFREGLFYRNYFYTKSFSSNSSLALFGEISPSLIFSKLKAKGHLTSGDFNEEFSEKSINHTSFSILPQVGVKYNVTPQIGFLLSTGYDINFDTKTNKLNYNTGIDWSGFRLSGGISYTFR